MHRAQYGLIEHGKRYLRAATLERVPAGLGEPAWAMLREVERS